MENFKNIKKMRNIKGVIVGEKLNGHRCEISRELIEDTIVNFVKSKTLGISEIESFLLKQRLINLLSIDNFEMYI
ncbi:hypothetical protein [Clostridium paraputrificum]|uniref:hypothetical protein n=1 Tax=Clostridium paraputrificum TaxID=29363 RepID=UPI0006694B3B|nr:hypothetical protein [Clostridium paraputrificum]MDB2105976.1 hypothetical protein [Clostridium paraputrificum]MDB2114302.1 hypothetical protein [Clostridium paraputrificum]